MLGDPTRPLPHGIRELHGTGGDPAGKGHPENPRPLGDTPTYRMACSGARDRHRHLRLSGLPAPRGLRGGVVRKNFFRPWIGWRTCRSLGADTAHVASSTPRPLVLLTQERCIPLAYDTRPLVKRPLTGPGPRWISRPARTSPTEVCLAGLPSVGSARPAKSPSDRSESLRFLGAPPHTPSNETMLPESANRLIRNGR